MVHLPHRTIPIRIVGRLRQYHPDRAHAKFVYLCDIGNELVVSFEALFIDKNLLGYGRNCLQSSGIKGLNELLTAMVGRAVKAIGVFFCLCERVTVVATRTSRCSDAPSGKSESRGLVLAVYSTISVDHLRFMHLIDLVRDIPASAENISATSPNS
jgi:hypothetical protein